MRAACIAFLLWASLASADEVISGYEFLTPETQALQDDDFANPGMLWVEEGGSLFAQQCADCHTQGSNGNLEGVAARYPAFDQDAQTLLNIEGRINRCREIHLQAEPLAYESKALLALSAYVANLSKGHAIDVDIDGAAQRYFTEGRDYFFRRKGQFNLACSQCHDDHWGRMLRGDRISQGHPNAFPGYRLEWQAMGSLHRRFQDCDAGIRAQPLALGSRRYRSLELYLAWRARGLIIEVPGVRR